MSADITLEEALAHMASVIAQNVRLTRRAAALELQLAEARAAQYTAQAQASHR